MLAYVSNKRLKNLSSTQINLSPEEPQLQRDLIFFLIPLLPALRIELSTAAIALSLRV